MQLQKDRKGEQCAHPPTHPNPTPASASQDSARQAGRTQAGTAQPADAEPLIVLRVIIETKAIFGGYVGGGHKNFVVGPVDGNTKAGQVKDSLERQGCGIKATAMNLMHGRTLMLNHQALGEFHRLDVARALDA
jgi:hypothetical protein